TADPRGRGTSVSVRTGGCRAPSVLPCAVAAFARLPPGGRVRRRYVLRCQWAGGQARRDRAHQPRGAPRGAVRRYGGRVPSPTRGHPTTKGRAVLFGDGPGPDRGLGVHRGVLRGVRTASAGRCAGRGLP